MSEAPFDRPSFDRGLVVGKFAPLHLGHELVIRRALDACREVVVLSWAKPELPGCPPEERERWLAARFPASDHPGLRVHVVTDEVLAKNARGELKGRTLPKDDEPWDVQQRFTALLCRDLAGVDRVDAVFTSEVYGDSLAATLSQVPGGRVEHVAVDPERNLVPISGTTLRADPHTHRRCLAPEVYASFVERIVLLGGESTGKTTLAAALAERLETTWVPEYGRDYWIERGGELVFDDMLHIAQVQCAREDAAALEIARGTNGDNTRHLVCDTSPLTTLFYSHDLFARADPGLEDLARRTYHHTVLCAPDFDFVQDGTRRPPGFRERQHAWTVDQLRRRGIHWIEAEGSIEERVETIARSVDDAPKPKETNP